MRPGEARRERADSGYSREHVGELVDIPVRQLVQVDVADPVAVGHERQRPPVRGPGGIDVLPLVHVPEDIDRAVVEVEQGDAQAAELECLEVGNGAAIGGERDGLAVRGPGRLEVGVLVVRQAVEVRAVSVHDEQVRQAAVVPCEHQLLPVGRPRRRREPVERDADAADLFVLLHIENHEIVAVLALRGDREIPPVG